jgi:hypothetical protein
LPSRLRRNTTVQGIYNGKYSSFPFPPPGGGREKYRPMSFEGEKMRKGKRGGGHRREKGEKEEKPRETEVKRICKRAEN